METYINENNSKAISMSDINVVCDCGVPGRQLLR